MVCLVAGLVGFLFNCGGRGKWSGYEAYGSVGLSLVDLVACGSRLVGFVARWFVV